MVAEPFLREQCFLHGVGILLDYDTKNGAMGLIINNGTSLMLGDIVDGIPTDIDVPVYCGGPMSQDRLFFLHTLGPDVIPDARAVSPGLWVGGDYDAAISYVAAGYPQEGYIRFILGYAGWSGGQLEQEIRNDVWAIAPAAHGIDAHKLLTLHGDKEWHTVVRAMGPVYRTWNLHPASFNLN